MKKFIMFVVSVCFLGVSYAGVFQTSMEQPVLTKKTTKAVVNSDSKTPPQYLETTCEIWANKIIIKKYFGSVTTTQTRTFSIQSVINEFEVQLKDSLKGPHTLSRASSNISAYTAGSETVSISYHVNVPLEGNNFVTEKLFETTSPLGESIKKNSAAADFLINFLNINCDMN